MSDMTQDARPEDEHVQGVAQIERAGDRTGAQGDQLVSATAVAEGTSQPDRGLRGGNGGNVSRPEAAGVEHGSPDIDLRGAGQAGTDRRRVTRRLRGTPESEHCRVPSGNHTGSCQANPEDRPAALFLEIVRRLNIPT